ncbi:DUF2085 domain-containing protein [Natronomonas marina]|jgi:uncharacterized membrane protein|uniref:DUF2085 domain-containing protein n=1 Tax=Natronomonas marina TaxID=2961939 RepID=UPI0020C9E588|nr:DUF2085 domain-containing protein [Natronomonas marina]
MIDRAEVREALAETRRYLLSHHEPHEFDRCYAPVLFGRRVRLCARCSGIYPGIAAGIVAHAVGPPAATGLALVALLPLPALVDWAATAFTDRRGHNPVRTATGAALGYGYGVGLGLLVGAGDFRVLAVGVAYGAAAAALLAVHRALDAEADGPRSSRIGER